RTSRRWRWPCSASASRAMSRARRSSSMAASRCTTGSRPPERLPSMRITRIETSRVSIPFETGGPRVGLRPSLSTRPWERMEALLVRIECEDGRVGWGEAFGHMVNGGTQAVLRELVGPWFLGKDSRQIAALLQEAQHAFHGFGRSGPVLYALSGLDIALWDLA